MTDLDEVRNWLFKGLSAESRLDELEQEGLRVRSDVEVGAVQRVLPIEGFSRAIRRSAVDSMAAYLAFFCLENAVRELVVQRLDDTLGSDWWEESVGKAIRDRVAGRRVKEDKNRWHAQRGAREIYYTDFGDLSLIIQGNWQSFQDLFPDQNWVMQRMRELENSRNIIAHSNTLEDREVQRLRMYLEDWVRQLG
ncbi:Swt1 family HEPN domain-containing protein [Isoptericola sp. AK164]|uniref:Swt1 family HEPN domain-containing protein n=1 Tax=Isoptericola sp. AK164 TaxID=3024246 RepID=UPI0024189CC0|nr:Swt1 family HEPN domain-containing protein [Isoptericola sp. AK164]